jgi:hypothetical protein
MVTRSRVSNPKARGLGWNTPEREQPRIASFRTKRESLTMFVYLLSLRPKLFRQKKKNSLLEGWLSIRRAQKRQSHHKGESQSGMTIRASVWVHDAVGQFV